MSIEKMSSMARREEVLIHLRAPLNHTCCEVVWVWKAFYLSNRGLLLGPLEA